MSNATIFWVYEIGAVGKAVPILVGVELGPMSLRAVVLEISWDFPIQVPFNFLKAIKTFKFYIIWHSPLLDSAVYQGSQYTDLNYILYPNVLGPRCRFTFVFTNVIRLYRKINVTIKTIKQNKSNLSTMSADRKKTKKSALCTVFPFYFIYNNTFYLVCRVFQQKVKHYSLSRRSLRFHALCTIKAMWHFVIKNKG